MSAHDGKHGCTHGEPIVGDTVLLLMSAHHEPIPFKLPLTESEQHWERVLGTAEEDQEHAVFAGGTDYPLKERSLAVLRVGSPSQSAEEVADVHLERIVKATRPPGPGRPPLD